jgi:RNA polymerase sigma-70 factor, ECF subfamily
MAVDAAFVNALDHLVEHDYARVVRAVALFSGTTEGAEDAVQEALARAMEHARKGRNIESLEGWVVTTAFNHRRSHFRRADRPREHYQELGPEFRSGPDAEALGSELLDLRAAVRALPTRQREVVVMYYYLDQSIDSIGRALRIGDGAVKNALHKARGALLVALSVDGQPRSRK